MSDLPSIDAELQILGSDRARLAVGGREYSGAVDLSAGLKQRLLTAELAPNQYGGMLFDALFGHDGTLLEGYRTGIVLAIETGRTVRLRVHLPIDQPHLHDIHWELLLDERERICPARWPLTAFSRYSPIPHPLGRRVTGRPRMLAAIAAPHDAEDFGLASLHREGLGEVLEHSLSSLSSIVDWEILPGPATLEVLRQRLRDGFEILHLLGHGLRGGPREAAIVLEQENGSARLVGEEAFHQMFSGLRGLRLLTLMACHGAARSGTSLFSGIGPLLVRSGLPAVIAMREAISIDSAVRFSRHFYQHLARSGVIDDAVNEARLQLYLAEPADPGWSYPILFMRMEDGRLWEEVQVEEPDRGSPTQGGERTSLPVARTEISGHARDVLTIGQVGNLRIGGKE